MSVSNHLALWRAEGLVEIALPLGERGAEEAHVTGVHQVLDLVLVLHDGFVGQADVEAVLLVLQIELALLTDIADREGDAVELAVILVDG